LNNSPIIIKIEPSKQLLVSLLCVHALALYALLLTSASLLVTLSITVFIALSFVFYINKSQEFSGVVAEADNEWILIMKDGSKLNCSLSNRTYLSNWLSLLVFISAEQATSKYVILMNDSVSAELLSQLKLRLKVNRDAD